MKELQEQSTLQKVKEMINIKNSEGEIITLFGGRITLGQLIAIIVGVIAVILLMKAIKGALKGGLIVGVVCVVLVYLGIASPEQISDFAKRAKSMGVEAFQSFADSSENIKIEGKKVYFRIEDNWIALDDIDSVIDKKLDSITVATDFGDLKIDDEKVIEMLEKLRE